MASWRAKMASKSDVEIQQTTARVKKYLDAAHTWHNPPRLTSMEHLPSLLQTCSGKKQGFQTFPNQNQFNETWPRFSCHFPQLSHVFYNAFRCGSIAGLGSLGSSRRCWSPSCTRPSAWWRLWTSTPVCWGIRRHRWTRRAKKQKSPGGWPDFSLWKC